MVTGLYNYGYRDYKPESARFTTVDPIRDGSNWYSYVMNDPVNYADVWGLSASDGKKNLSGDIYVGFGLNIVGMVGFDVSTSIVIDLDNLGESGLNFSGGFAGGVSIGAGIGLGYVTEQEGVTLVTTNVSFPFGSISGNLSENGGGAGYSVGPGFGFNVSRQHSETITVNDIIEPIKQTTQIVIQKINKWSVEKVQSIFNNFTGNKPFTKY